MRPLAFALLVLVFLPHGLSGQDTRGSIDGRIIDTLGEPVPSVLVTVRGPALQGERSRPTGAGGGFSIQALPVGTYSVELTRLGYQSRSLTDVVVLLGRTTSLGALVMAETPVVLEPIEARASRLLIDPVSTAGGVNLTPDLFEDLPVGRGYQEMISLLPQANVSYLGDGQTMVGGTGMENRYFIEGADVTDPMRGLYTIDLPYNFVREVEVKTGGYEAEYRSSLAGILNVVTYSGGEETRAQAFGFYSSDQLSGTPRTAGLQLNRSDVRRWDIGATLEGPITRDRLWYFLAYNPLVTSENVQVPDLDWYQNDELRHRFAGKLTWQAATGTSLYGTVFGDPATHDAVAAPRYYSSGLQPLTADSWLSSRRNGGVTALAGITQTMGSSGLLEVTVSRLWVEASVQPRTPGGAEPRFNDFTNGTMSGGIWASYTDRQTRTALRAVAAWDLGSHALKAGGEYTGSRLDTDWSMLVIDKLAEDRWRTTELLGDAKAVLESRVPGLFLQDSWLVAPGFRLNAGLRWESQYLVGSDGEVAQRLLNEWQPRLGFVLMPGRQGYQRVYGSFGRFYQDLTLTVAGLTFNDGLIWRFTSFDHDPREDPSGGAVVGEVGTLADETEGLRGQHYDEFTLGYERQVGGSLKLGARGVYRTLRRAVEDSWAESSQDLILGNPGFEELSEYPNATRRYAALEFTAEKSFEGDLRLVGSYVLSRTSGNYSGVFSLDENEPIQPNGQFDDLVMLTNGDGVLPQDRTHQLKIAASYRVGSSLALGGRLLWLSGTPLSEMGTGRSRYGGTVATFLTPRGTAGRTPSIFELDLRLTYDFGNLLRRDSPARLVFDVFNIGNPRRAVAFDQFRYFSVDGEGNPGSPNPHYGKPTAYQLPASLRLGVEVGF